MCNCKSSNTTSVNSFSSSCSKVRRNRMIKVYCIQIFVLLWYVGFTSTLVPTVVSIKLVKDYSRAEVLDEKPEIISDF